MRAQGLWSAGLAAALAMTLTMAGCGGGDSTPTSPSPAPAPAPTPAPTPTPTPTPAPTPSPGATATITISGNAVSPREVTIAAGGRVTFVNNDNRAHDMASDPHPEHTLCPEINQTGFLQPGQSGTTGNLNTPRTCTFHDHNADTNTNLRGTIRIQ